jgi:hypothetical protein
VQGTAAHYSSLAMAISLPVRTPFACAVDDKAHRRRRQRRAIAVVAFLVAAIIALLLLRVINHSPVRTPIAVRPNPPATKFAPVTGLPGVICTGQHKTIARTPTKEDLKRLKRNAPNVLKQAATGRSPKMPTEITGRLLPDGTFSGSCVYGPQTPATTAPGSNY